MSEDNPYVSMPLAWLITLNHMLTGYYRRCLDCRKPGAALCGNCSKFQTWGPKIATLIEKRRRELREEREIEKQDRLANEEAAARAKAALDAMSPEDREQVLAESRAFWERMDCEANLMRRLEGAEVLTQESRDLRIPIPIRKKDERE